jgi:Tfp pilus assembly protein PilF
VFSNDVGLFNRRATAHFHLGNLQDALTDFNTVLEMEPRHFGALCGIGLVQAKQNDFSAASQSFTAALDVHPWYSKGRRLLAQNAVKEADFTTETGV